jgi:outer membrane protein assembly factor BamB
MKTVRACSTRFASYPSLMHRICLSSLILILASFTLPGRAENWPQFRGPRGDGTSVEKNVPTHWSQTENVAWKTPLPGVGHSSPVVWENSVFLTSATEDGKRLLIRLDANSGKILWEAIVAKTKRESMHRENSRASSTVATDGQRIITSFQVGDRVQLSSYNYEGKLEWSIQPLRFSGEHGYSYSPIFYQDLVIFDCRQEGDAATLAIEKQSGRIRWRTEPGMKRISHITPLVIKDGAREQLVVSGSNETASYDPRTGKRLWWCEGPSDVAVAGMCFGDGLIFVTAGYPDRTRMGVRVDGSGDVTASGVAWSSRRQVSYVPSPVYHQGHVYSVVDEGMLNCFDMKTGATKWDQRLGGRFRSSMILANGLIYTTNDKGLTTVFRASSEGFQQVSANDLREFCYTTPAISDGHLFLRTEQNIYCISAAQKL